ncbi:MAG: quinone-dependent dihydroorotate dehydrogenase, partial [Rhodocyclaceae bacterium]|nr:quinone-dependent dihydroorotate dehydrogenase [Rhodocyclaceae bacterium]
MLPYCLVRPMVFALDAEDAHDLTIAALKTAGALLPSARNESGPPVPAMGLAFPSRVGLAAGLDKNGECIEAWFRLGFGFVELGTVTPRPQPGNPRPRLFRLPEVQGIVNRMGFNNLGVDHLVTRVLAARENGIRGIIGINIGKNFDTPIEKAADDYLACLERVYPHADYVTVNISSPNTKNLRQLQGESELDALLAALARRRESLADRHGRRTPLALKIAPDLESAQIVQIADALRRHRIDAVIATNTTLSREGVEQLRHGGEAGGLSGGPLFERSTAVLRELAAALAGEIPIVAAGGITDGGRA